jgi:hypothetical protein
MDNNENFLISAIDDTFVTNDLEYDFYILGASLMQNPDGYGSYYDYDEEFDNYSLDVKCPDANDSIENIANILDISLVENIQNEVSEVNTTRIFQSGWHLSGAEYDLNISDLKCENSLLQSVWTYKDAKWKLNSKVDGNFGFEYLDNLKLGDGFWINCN